MHKHKLHLWDACIDPQVIKAGPLSCVAHEEHMKRDRRPDVMHRGQSTSTRMSEPSHARCLGLVICSQSSPGGLRAGSWHKGSAPARTPGWRRGWWAAAAAGGRTCSRTDCTPGRTGTGRPWAVLQAVGAARQNTGLWLDFSTQCGYVTGDWRDCDQQCCRARLQKSSPQGTEWCTSACLGSGLHR